MDDAHTKPRTFTLPERVRIARTLHAHGLGHVRLPGITTGPTCMGYEHCCQCADCLANPKPATGQPAQPWEPRTARHAA